MNDIWVTILLSLIGIFSGGVISFYFFRSQQKDAISKLSANIAKLNSRESSSERVEKYLIEQRKNLNEVLNQMSKIQTSINFSEKIENHDKLNDVKSTLDNIKESFKSDLSDLKKSIDDSFTSIISRFDNGNFNATKMLHSQLAKEFQKDVKLFIPSSELESEVLASKLVDNFLKLYKEINQIQRENLNSDREHFLKNVDDRIDDSFNNFQSRFEESFQNFESKLSLPNSGKQKK
ncbi:hypothetical protein [Maribellus sediminis]|uniref:hypothetical protein n=1 Tax=Maribellus sediminis TaxID=2696285 RepID=UPI001431C67A|nr:hypothetical protein [Maribellus sediminis]